MTEGVIFEDNKAKYLLITEGVPVVLAENDSITSLMIEIENMGYGHRSNWPLSGDPATLSRAIAEQTALNRISPVYKLSNLAMLATITAMRVDNKYSQHRGLTSLVFLVSLLLTGWSVGAQSAVGFCLSASVVFASISVLQYLSELTRIDVAYCKGEVYNYTEAANVSAEVFLEACNKLDIYYGDIDPVDRQLIQEVKSRRNALWR